VIALSAAAYSADTKKGLEPFTYKEDFETNELSAWASYPLWQDTAYDPNMRPDTPVPGDPNIALCQRVTPYSNVDNYAGARAPKNSWTWFSLRIRRSSSAPI